MKVNYDIETDSLTITLGDGAIEESDEIRPGVIADVDSEGNILRFEILSASKRVQNTREMQFSVGEGKP